MLLMGSGCTRSLTPGTNSSPILSPQTLLSRVQASSSRLIDLTGTALVSASLHDRQGRADTRILFRQPDQLKLIIQGPFGQTFALISRNGETVQCYLPLQNTVFEGSIEDGLDEVLPGLHVRLADIQTGAIGLIDLTRYHQAHLIDYHRDGEQYILTVQTDEDGTTRKVWIDGKRSVVTREEENRGDGRMIVRTFEGYIRTKGIWRPSRVRIAGDDTREAVTVQFQTQAVNTGLSAADLALALPKTVRRLPLSRSEFQEGH